MMYRLILIGLLLGTPVAGQQRPRWALPSQGEATTIRLIIRGDDFGDTHASNLAMERGFRSGLMTAASVIAGAPWASEAVALVLSNADWDVGLHLIVSSEWDRLRWGPLASPADVTSLVGLDGKLFHSYPGAPLALEFLMEPPYLFPGDIEMPPDVLTRRRLLTSDSPPDAGDVEAELRAQIKRAQDMGLRIDYLDCHMGLVCSPALRPILIRLAAELCVPIPEEGWMGSQRVGFTHENDFEIGEREFVRLLNSLEPGLYRLVLHPNLDSPEVQARDSYFGPKSAEAGELELELLESATVRDAISRNAIELVSVRDLWNYDTCRLRTGSGSF